MSQRIVACIMAGGVGSRFWPASREEKPKQFLDILGLGRSLLQLTYDRYIQLGLKPDDIFVVTNQQYISLVQQHLPDIPQTQIIGEPARRNTAPAAYLGNKLIEARCGDAIVVMAPSDHHIEDVDAFNRVIKIGKTHLEWTDDLITVGIQPTFPHTGYGYINFASSDQLPFRVQSFTEKPNLRRATEFLRQGDYLWNAGIFMWKTSTLDKAFAQHAQGIKNIIDENLKIVDGVINQLSLELAFEKVVDSSIDYEIMERAENVVTIPADMKWSDLGSWKSLYDKSDKNTEGNFVAADKYLITDAQNNLIFAPGKKVVLKGLKDYMIIEDDHTIVICPLSDDQEVKKWRSHFVD